jgi:outer membrane protein OmpA-like peptidoglycan-associated protein
MWTSRFALATTVVAVVAGTASAQIPLQGGERDARADKRALVGPEKRALIGRVRQLVGAPVPRPVRRRFRTVILFRFDEDGLLKRARRRLKRLAEQLGDRRIILVRIGGYADAIGEPPYNVGLSRRRAQRACAFLGAVLDQEIPDCRLRAHGERHAAQPNAFPDGSDNAEGRKRNRRAVVRVLVGR